MVRFVIKVDRKSKVWMLSILKERINFIKPLSLILTQRLRINFSKFLQICSLSTKLWRNPLVVSVQPRSSFCTLSPKRDARNSRSFFYSNLHPWRLSSFTLELKGLLASESRIWSTRIESNLKECKLIKCLLWSTVSAPLMRSPLLGESVKPVIFIR